ncbi:MAG: hypothetical protein GXY44_13425 [Phycisphaerales bacterium]|nr:hypothetical protein [Phycisphaerales bacterium]
MAIQFQCPACRQPIEIEEQWAGQPVACPYCQRVVTAPTQSSWPGEQIPTASPTSHASDSAHPHPSAVSATDPFSSLPPASSAKGIWAFILACTATVLCILAYVSFSVNMAAAIVQTVGPNATPQEQQEAMTKVMTEGKIPHSPLASASVIVGTASGLGSLALALLALVRREGGRGLAIAALVITPLFLFCQLGLLLLMSMHSKG